MSPKLKLALSTLFFWLLFGTIFYHVAEGWSFVDSFYFTSITLSTIGYGDIHPTKTVTKLFTSVFAIAGVAMAIYALTLLGADYFEKREKELEGKIRETTQKTDRLSIEMLRADKHLIEMLKEIDRQIKK